MLITALVPPIFGSFRFARTSGRYETNLDPEGEQLRILTRSQGKMQTVDRRTPVNFALKT
jgi:hypothetical protein